MSWHLLGTSVDKTARLFVQDLAICSIENMPNNKYYRQSRLKILSNLTTTQFFQCKLVMCQSEDNES